MTCTLLLAAVLASGVRAAAPPPTLRVDYYHTGDASEERFSIERMVIEPLPWPGNPARPIDDTNRGKYLFEVVDAASGRTIFSRGFASIYGEWETTAEAKSMHRTFSESLRFPLIDAPARVVVKKRDAKNRFRDVWTFAIDPGDKFIERGAAPDAAGRLIRLQESGDPSEKLDLLILGDGYTAAERAKFDRDARRLVDALFATSPFKARRRDINVWGLCPAAAQSGVSRPSQRIYRRSPIGTTYDAFDSERYILTFENRAFRDIAANAPYDAVEILVNSATYGGGGIFGLYSTVAADSAWAPYIFVHEFGHHIAGLADEYYTSDVAYLPATDRVEPWEPNATALLDPATLKWKDLVAPGTPLPTPWPKEERFKRGAARSAPPIGRKPKSMRSSARSRLTTRHCSAEDRLRGKSAPSKARTTRRADISARRPTASCSRATLCRSAQCAAARSRRFWTCTAADSGAGRASRCY